MPPYAAYKICRHAGQNATEAFFSTLHYRTLRAQGATPREARDLVVDPPTLTLSREELISWSNTACDHSDYQQNAVISRALAGEWLALYRLQFEHNELKAEEAREERQWQEHLDAGGDPW